MSAVFEAQKLAIEAVGPTFSKQQMLKMRDRTRAAIDAIAAKVTPGMIEEDAVKMAKELLASQGMRRGWHEVVVRFGRNTLKTFGDPSEPRVALKDQDLFFIDIGPVWEDCEGDGGATFVVGGDSGMKQCAQASRSLFHIVRRQWKSTGMSGKELYAFAQAQAANLGFELNLELCGHRLSEFPHAAIYNGTLAEVDFKPSPLVWILEIHIRHPTAGYGAFFEDMLLDDSYFADSM